MFTIQELLGIKYPIIQGGMANVSNHSLVAAVSEAGGLGVLASGGFSAQEVRENIQKVREKTKKPFAVNFALSYPNIEEIMEVAEEEKVEYIISGGGNPTPYFSRWKKAGFKIIPVVGNTRMAKKVEELGAMACIFEGAEAGGHIGGLNTMGALPSIVDAVDIPVIAAGGIATGRQMLAAEVLGATGVQIGTRFLASKECDVHPDYKQAVIDAKDTDVIVTGYMAHPVRGMKNQFTEKYLRLEKEGGHEMELMKLATGTSRRASQEGDVEWGSVLIGQAVGYVQKSESVEEIIQTLQKEYQEAKDKIKK